MTNERQLYRVIKVLWALVAYIRRSQPHCVCDLKRHTANRLKRIF